MYVEMDVEMDVYCTVSARRLICQLETIATNYREM